MGPAEGRVFSLPPAPHYTHTVYPPVIRTHIQFSRWSCHSLLPRKCFVLLPMACTQLTVLIPQGPADMPPAPGHFPWSPWWNQDPRSRAEPRGKEPPPEDNGEQHSTIPRSTKNRGGGQDLHTPRYWLLSVKERRHPLPQSGNISMVLENGEVMSRRRAVYVVFCGPSKM